MVHHDHERPIAAKRRALRAARAVTLSVFASLGGCAATVSSGPSPDVAEPDAVPTDAPAADTSVTDTAVADAAAEDASDANAAEVAVADAASDVSPDVGESCSRTPDGGETWSECCQRIGWDWERGCAAWGPFMPPSMEA